jgi:hypothetical protein
MGASLRISSHEGRLDVDGGEKRRWISFFQLTKGATGTWNLMSPNGRRFAVSRRLPMPTGAPLGLTFFSDSQRLYGAGSVPTGRAFCSGQSD